MRKLAIAGAALSLLLAGCARAPSAPSIAIFGSFFPGWIICAALGIVVAVVARQVLIRTGVDEFLPLAPLVYLCLSITAGIVVWFVWFGGVPQ